MEKSYEAIISCEADDASLSAGIVSFSFLSVSCFHAAVVASLSGAVYMFVG